MEILCDKMVIFYECVICTDELCVAFSLSVTDMNFKRKNNCSNIVYFRLWYSISSILK
jgi:hypothetical protein